MARPDPRLAAWLVSGEDAARVAMARETLLLALVGPEGDAEMRLGRLSGADLRRDPALLLDATKEVGFFPGPRAVWVAEATDGCAPALEAALADWREGDARMVLTGGALTGKGALRKLVESQSRAAALTLYDDPPSAAEVLSRLTEAGVGEATTEARDLLVAVGQSIPEGELRGLIERLALHEADAEGPLQAATVAALAPGAGEGDLDALAMAVTDGAPPRVAAELSRLTQQGTGAVAAAIAVQRHLRALHALLSDPGGAQAGLGALRPPPAGARRAALERAARGWSRERAERALREMVALDLRLRSAGQRAPEAALVERALMRIAARGE